MGKEKIIHLQSNLLVQYIPHLPSIIGLLRIFLRSRTLLSWCFCSLGLSTLDLHLFQGILNFSLDLVHLVNLILAPLQLLLHHHYQRFPGLVWSVEVEEVVGVDKQVAQIIHFGFELFGRNRESSHELEEIE